MWFGKSEDVDTESTPLSKELYEELPVSSSEMGALRSGRGSHDRHNAPWSDLRLGLVAFVVTFYVLMYIHPSVLIKPASRSSAGAGASSHSHSRTLPSNRPKVHFITYGDGLYEHSKERLQKEAEHTGWFQTVDAWDSRNLSTSFKRKFDVILQMDQQGGGYWIWKFDIVRTMMQKYDKGDYIVYLDSGCEIDEKNEKRFYEYVDALSASNFSFLGFPVAGEMKENVYTTRHIYAALDSVFHTNLTPEKDNSVQLLGGVQLIKNNDVARHGIDVILALLEKDPYLITYRYNRDNQIPSFEDNRHDQSFFSIMRKHYGVVIYPAHDLRKGSIGPFVVSRRRDEADWREKEGYS